MAKYGLMLLISAFILAVTFQQANGLKCWRCSSDSATAAFCDDPFQEEKVSEQQRRWSFVSCDLPTPQSGPYINTNQRPVCKKMRQLINDRYVISRSCAWEDLNATPNTCLQANTPSYITTEFCETCSYDGCNGAAQFSPIAFVVLLPVLLAKLLSM